MIEVSPAEFHRVAEAQNVGREHSGYLVPAPVQAGSSQSTLHSSAADRSGFSLCCWTHTPALALDEIRSSHIHFKMGLCMQGNSTLCFKFLGA